MASCRFLSQMAPASIRIPIASGSHMPSTVSSSENIFFMDIVGHRAKDEVTDDFA